MTEGNTKIIENPFFLLNKSNPWEIRRHEVSYTIPIYGKIVKKKVTLDGMDIEKTFWTETTKIHALAYDTAVPGFNTFNTNNLRLWSAYPYWEDIETP